MQLIDKTARKGAEGLNIGFLHPKSTMGVLTESAENNNTYHFITQFYEYPGQNKKAH